MKNNWYRLLNKRRLLSIFLSLALLFSQAVPLTYAGDAAGQTGGFHETAVVSDVGSPAPDTETQTQPADTRPEGESGTSGDTEATEPAQDTEDIGNTEPTQDAGDTETTEPAQDIGDTETTEPAQDAETDPGELAPAPLLALQPDQAADYDISWYQEGGSPFTLENEAQFRGLAALVNGTAQSGDGTLAAVSFQDQTITLDENIVLTEAWTPIGTAENPFSGTFDGNGKTVRELSIDSPDAYQGLFGALYAAVVSGLTVDGSVESSAGYVGGIAGYALASRITDCTNEAAVTGGGIHVGGIAGYSTGKITGCRNEGAVTSACRENTVYAGGITGYSTGTIARCENDARVTGAGNVVGGIVGINHGQVENCLSTGAVMGGNFVGGIAGRSTGTLRSSVGLGAITASGAAAGDIAGDGTVTACLSLGQSAASGGVDGAVLTAAEMKQAKAVWILNTLDCTRESSDVWKLGEAHPEFGDGPVYKIVLLNYAPSVTLSLKTGEDDVVVERTGTQPQTLTAYVEEGAVTVNAQAETLSGFHFFPQVEGDEDAYRFTVDADKSFQCGFGELPGERNQEQIAWYIGRENEQSYTISSAKQMAGLAALVNGTALDSSGKTIGAVSFDTKTVTLSADVDLQTLGNGGGEPYAWTPIGSGSYYFKGTFNGAGHKVSGLYLHTAQTRLGLFMQTSGGSIRNLTVEGEIDNGTASYTYTGGIVGYSTATQFSNCTSRVKIVRAGYSAGGIAGYAAGTISNCNNEGDINSSGSYASLGGIVGNSTKAISNCNNEGTVSGSGSYPYVGGIAGSNTAAVTGCTNGGTITSGTTGYAGGIAGSGSGEIRDCLNSGAVSGGDYVGGIAGMGGTVKNCFSSGVASGTGAAMGQIAGSGTVTNSFTCGQGTTAASGQSGTAATAEALRYGRVVWQLNTTDGAAESSGIWKQGETLPEFGSSTVYQVKITNYSSDVSLSFKLGEQALDPSAAFPVSGSTCVYVPAGTLTILPSGSGLSDFGFQSGACADGAGGYSLTVGADTVLRCGRAADLSAGTGALSRVGWYTDNPGAAAFTISSEDELWGLMALVNGEIQGYAPVSFSGKTITLGADVNLSNLASPPAAVYEWTPVGTEQRPFSGTFDGGGHTVGGLSLTGSGNNRGLFGYMHGGGIKNLTVSGHVSGGDNVGGLVGNAQSASITGCTAENLTVSGGDNVGGLVGNSTGAISSAVLSGNSSVSGTDNVGGVAGACTGAIKNCYALGRVAATGAGKGAIAGTADTLLACFYYREGSVLNLAGTAASVMKSFYLADADRDGAPGSHRTKEEFGNRELAYVLDTASGSHSNVWQVGADFPVFGGGTVYRLSLSAKQTQAGKSVSLRAPVQTDSYTVYDGENGGQYTYLLSGERVPLDIVSDDATRIPYYYPNANAVGTDEQGTYIIMGAADLALTYSFAGASTADLAWYLEQPAGQTSYSVSGEAQLRGLAALVNGTASDADGTALAAVDFAGKTVSLTGDVSVQGSDWVPIGTQSHPFNGAFDGAGFNVSGFFIDTSSNNQGLFGYLNTGSVVNLTVDGTVRGGLYVGGVAGFIGDTGSVKNCENLGAVTGTGAVGGIVGSIGKNSLTQDCRNSGEIRATSSDFAGGISGEMDKNSVLAGCSNSGAVTGAGRYVGGVSGNPFAGAKVTLCQNSGIVTGSGNYVGGVAGGIDSGLLELSDCSNSGLVTGMASSASSDTFVGGVVGDIGNAAATGSVVKNCGNSGAVCNKSTRASDTSVATGGVFGRIGSNYGGNFGGCFNTGAVVSSASNTGGLCGVLLDGSTLEDSYNTGSVSGQKFVGGVVGYKANATTSAVASAFCYAESVSGTDSVGAVAGNNPGNLAGCYYLDTMSIQKGGAPADPADAGSAIPRSAEQFRSFDLAYLLNTRGDTVAQNRGIWAQGEAYPVYAPAGQELVYKVAAEPGANGGIRIGTEGATGHVYAAEGRTVTLTLLPDQGYIVGSYTVRDVLGAGIDSTYTENGDGSFTVTLTVPAKGVQVRAVFVQPVTGTFTVTFDGNGGGWRGTQATETTRVQQVVANSRLNMPENPTWSARIFKGWYTDPAATQPYNGSTAVQSEFTLYAGWEICYGVTFDPNGGQWTDPADGFVVVAADGTAACPEAVPVLDGYEFVGWYTDKDQCIVPYNFTAKVQDDVTVYAGWTPAGTYQVVFFPNFLPSEGTMTNAKGEHLSYYKAAVPKGTAVQTPGQAGYTIVKNPTADGSFTLRGWYNNPNTGTKWDFAKPVSQNMVLYAHWDGDTPEIVGGTEDAPMELEDMDQLIALRDSVNKGTTYQALYFKLSGDLTLPDGWVPIGTSASHFKAYFDGGGYTLSVPEGGKPLFGTVDSAEIRDLDIYGEEIDGSGLIDTYTGTVLIDSCTVLSGTNLKGSGFVGNVPGSSNASLNIQNCVVESGVTVGYTMDQDYVGGIAGNVSAIITNCTSDADVYGANYVGGIVGKKGQSMTAFEIHNCRSGGTVTGTGNYVGGIVGGGYNGGAPASPGVLIYDSYSIAAVRGGDDVGGILGGDTASSPPSNGRPTITNCYWFGPSIEADGEYTGGIVGYYATVNANCVLSNNYFAADGGESAELRGIGAIGNNALAGFDPEAAFRSMSADTFASGEVAYLLDGGEGEHRGVWTQEDGLPAWGEESVYRVQATSTGDGQISLSEGAGDGIAAVYHKNGEPVSFAAVPSSETSSVTNEDGSTTTTKWQVKSLTVTFADGDTADLTGSASFVMRAGDASVSAVFEQTSTTTPKPHKPKDNDQADDSGSGIILPGGGETTPATEESEPEKETETENETGGNAGNGPGIGNGTGGAGSAAGNGSGGAKGGKTVGVASAAPDEDSAGTEQVIAPSEQANPDQEQVELPETAPNSPEEPDVEESEPEQEEKDNLSQTQTPRSKQWTFVLIALLGAALAAGIIRYVVYLVHRKNKQRTGGRR